MIFFGKNSEFFKVINGNKKNKNKNATQDFHDFSVGRERANKQFFFWPYCQLAPPPTSIVTTLGTLLLLL